MNGSTCPRCHGPLPEGVVRELLVGTKCPFCAVPLKRSAGRTAIEVVSADSGGFASIPKSSPPAETAKLASAKPMETAKPASAKPMETAKLASAVKPAAPLASVSAPRNMRATIVGTARAMPFDGTPAPTSFALSPPTAPPPVRPPPAPVRAAAATAPALPARGGAAAAAARTIAAPAPTRAPSVRPSVAPAAGRPARSLTPAQALDLPPPTPAPVLHTPAPAPMTQLVADSDSEPTHVMPPSRHEAPAPLLGGDDSESIIEAVTMTAEPDSAPLVSAASPLYAQPRRHLPLIGVGMGVAIVAVVVIGIKVLSGPKRQPAPAVAAEVARPAPEPEPIAQPLEPPQAKAPAQQAKAAPVKPASKSAARVAERQDDAPVASTRHSRSHSRGATAHHRHERHARKVATREPAAKSAAVPAAESPDPRPHYERGNALLFSGDGKGAIGAYREAVKLAPNDPIGFRGLGLAYEQQGDTASALRALRRYLKLAPTAPDREIITRRIERLGHRAKK